MKVNGQPYRSIWQKPDDPEVVQIIDQRHLPHRFVIEDLRTVEQTAEAIREMHVRGAPLIGAAAAYGIYLAGLNAPKTSSEAFKDALFNAAKLLGETRPTAVNLAWALEQMLIASDKPTPTLEDKIENLRRAAEDLTNAEVEACRMIGEHGVELITAISEQKGGGPVNILTHCNAGWLACVDYGTATAPIYAAHERGIPVHVWVDETRPRNQGARLTAWEWGSTAWRIPWWSITLADT